MGIEKGKYELIPTKKIDISEWNVRKSNRSRNLDTLKESLALEGLIQPIVVATKEGNRYEVIVGQRRFLAAQELDWEKIPAIVMSGPVDKITAIKMSIAENIHRIDPLDDDIAEACKILHDTFGKGKIVAEKLGLTEKQADEYATWHDVPKGLKAQVRAKKVPRDRAIAWTRDAYDAEGNVDEERIKELIELDQSGELTDAERKRVPATLKKKPKAPIEDIKKEVKKPPKDYILKRIVMPWKQGERLKKATEHRGFKKPTETARTAIIDWLDMKGY